MNLAFGAAIKKTLYNKEDSINVTNILFIVLYMCILSSFIRKYLNVQTSLQRPAVNIQFTKTDEEIASARVAFAAIVRHCYI